MLVANRHERCSRGAAALLLLLLMVAVFSVGGPSLAAAAAHEEPAAFVHGAPSDAVVSGDLVVAGNSIFEIQATYRMDATAYTAGPESTGKHPGHPAYGITRSGTQVEEGRTVAVDPDVIPLGTWIYIEELGLFRAEDTGGAIKGQRIDVYIEDVDRALSFGYREGLTVHVLTAAGTQAAF